MDNNRHARRSGMRSARLWACCVLLVLLSARLVADANLDLIVSDPQLLAAIESRHGVAARERLQQLADLIMREQDLPEADKLARVNDFFNRMRFVSDQKQWGVDDYWASPVEFVASNAGDCEDFALAKYFTLLALDVDGAKMRLTYVNAIDLGQAHMVLAYYPSPEAEPLVLDNLTPQILPASARPDLIPVYSFNGVGLWLAKERGQGRFAGSSTQLSRWVELNRRMARNRTLP